MENTEFKAKWVAALRSGKFIQNRCGWSDDYSKPKKFCCIGVAGTIAGFGFADYTDVRDAAGMSEDVLNALIEMNDDEVLSFNEIADWLETHDLAAGEIT